MIIGQKQVVVVDSSACLHCPVPSPLPRLQLWTEVQGAYVDAIVLVIETSHDRFLPAHQGGMMINKAS